MNSDKNKTSEPHVLKLKLTSKLLNLRLGKKVIYCIIESKHLLHMEEHKCSCNNNKFKISAPTWNKEFTLPDGSYSVSDIQDYFEYILIKHGEKLIIMMMMMMIMISHQ